MSLPRFTGSQEKITALPVTIVNAVRNSIVRKISNEMLIILQLQTALVILETWYPELFPATHR